MVLALFLLVRDSTRGNEADELDDDDDDDDLEREGLRELDDLRLDASDSRVDRFTCSDDFLDDLESDEEAALLNSSRFSFFFDFELVE
jgi:hypothetical protein